MRFGSGLTARRANLAARYGLVSFLALMSTHQIAWANAAQQQFDIPAQNLSASLQAVATQSHAQLLYSPELVGKINAPALKSSVTVEEALRQLLQGSGLELKVTGDNAFAIIKAGSVSGNSAPVTVLDTVTVTATRTENSTFDLPASVGTVTQKQIENSQAQDMASVGPSGARRRNGRRPPSDRADAQHPRHVRPRDHRVGGRRPS